MKQYTYLAYHRDGYSKDEITVLADNEKMAEELARKEAISKVKLVDVKEPETVGRFGK